MNSEIKQGEFARYQVFGEIAGKMAGQLQKACRTCVTCEHFDDKAELCKLNGLRPPAFVIAFGCECFEDRIPF
jgi:hypothetical protein